MNIKRLEVDKKNVRTDFYFSKDDIIIINHKRYKITKTGNLQNGGVYVSSTEVLE